MPFGLKSLISVTIITFSCPAMRKSLCLLVVFLTFCITSVFAQNVQINYAKNSPRQAYAAGVLNKALHKKGYSLKMSNHRYTIILVTDSVHLGHEAFTISPKGSKIKITGGDEVGLIYGCQSIAEDLLNDVTLQQIKAKSEAPHFPFRAIKFDLPWDTYRHSDALDLHYQTCRDTNYWKAFLDMMAQNRFNVLTLWNLHPYTYMIRAKNFPEATPFSD